MDKRREDVLEAPYFHVVFTVPQELNSLIYSNQQLLYDALYHCVSETINELTADTKHLGAKVGYICVLHTWGSEMNYHPHIHVILLGGGLTAQNQWRDKGEEFFLPVRVMSKLFRGKYLDILKMLWNENKLQFHGRSEQKGIKSHLQQFFFRRPKIRRQTYNLQRPGVGFSGFPNLLAGLVTT